ncbi:MAG: hypothetical protein LC102_10060 [Ignavibacteriales bacterium]|jgi:hypothetical protein|nr:MAG: hypothetical protein F9K26_12265 [Ignavibacteriaceae bacterium]MBW7872124.1 hypothetical protein [Ignavibacteria bacterium]MBZ0197749.1 hypothetical protein [Ignavibacteriaceae bacterium]MCZ2143758.1 hypothetical protein [Ignavibacteriales bacterium]WKZ73717.1 MAG: hypothetical protein QY308_05795 [Ignavibacteriaceae bacterium]
MNNVTDNKLLFSDENFLAQLEESEYETGFYRVQFYSNGGRPSATPTDTIETYFYYPSGGTFRDKNFNIVEYYPRFDITRGFKPPHLREK